MPTVPGTVIAMMLIVVATAKDGAGAATGVPPDTRCPGHAFATPST